MIQRKGHYDILLYANFVPIMNLATLANLWLKIEF